MIHLVWLFKFFPICFPFTGFHNLISLSIDPDASIDPSGDQAIQRTQFLCPSQVKWGVSVLISQNLTVVSPDPEAKCAESGLKDTLKTASVCPKI